MVIKLIKNKNFKWYKFKSVLISIILFIILNLYLIYLISRYIVDKTISSLIILISNELFLFMGILFYLYLINKIKVNQRLEELEYIFNKK